MSYLRNHLKVGIVAVLVVLLCASVTVTAQEQEKTKWPEKTFTIEKEYWRTPVLSQGGTGTCWSFSTTSFFESEINRLYDAEIDLSEMFTVYHVYIAKADYYIRMHGNNTFAEGGFSHDLLMVMDEFGAMPADVYTGLWEGEKGYNHSELSRVLSAMLDALLQSGGYGRPSAPSMKWMSGFKAALGAYLGTPPESFEFNGTTTNAKDFFTNSVKLNPDDYVELTSFLYMPYYKPSEHVIPDNWMHYDKFYNLPLDEFMQTLAYALDNGYTVAISTDVSEEGFNQKRGYAMLKDDLDGIEPVTAEQREEMWNRWKTTDDHGMHAVGVARDEEGNVFYLVKNSWGTNPERTGPYNGHIYMHENFLRAKMHAYLLHKDAIPAEIREKLGL
jgi:bleomycin hydrolase